jgi:hypothetical protein
MIRVAECDAEGGLVDVCMRTGDLPRRALPSCGGGPVLVRSGRAKSDSLLGSVKKQVGDFLGVSK